MHSSVRLNCIYGNKFSIETENTQKVKHNTFWILHSLCTHDCPLIAVKGLLLVQPANVALHNLESPLMSSFPVGDQTEIDTFIGVGVVIGMLLLIVVLVLVSIIVVVAMVKRSTANKQMESVKMKKNPSYYNPVAVEMAVKGLGYDYEDADKDKSNGSVVDGFDPYEDVDSKSQMKNTKKLVPKESSTPTSAATNAGELYAVVDKSKKGGKQKQEEDGCTVTNKDDLYTVPMKKDKMTDEGKCASGCVEKSEEYDDVAGLKYEPKVDTEPQQSSEGDNKVPNADMLYAVVDKSHKKKK